jgi:hypothetical protein
MATQRIESGRVQMASVGGVPMQQITPRQIDYTTAANIQARGANQLSQVIDRMSQTAFQVAGELSKQAAMEDVANTPLTPEQLEAAKNGDMSQLGIGGSRLNIYDATVRKARSFELASAFDTEAKAEVVKILSDVENGGATSEQTAQKLNTMTNGFTQSLAQVDPDAALKFKASMGVYANTVMAEAHKSEMKRAKEKQGLLLESNFTNTMKLLMPTLEQGFYVDANGQEQPIEPVLEVLRKNVSDSAFAAGGLPMAKEYLAKFDKEVKDGKINVATKILLTEEYMRDPSIGMERVLAGDFGRFSPVWMMMDEDDKKAVRDNYASAIKARKEGIELSLGNSQRQGDQILRQIYLAPNVASMNQLFTQLNGLPVSPSTISQARSFIRTMSTEGRATDDLAAFGRVTQRIALGVATQEEIISGPFSNATKRTLIGQQSNPGNAINAGISRINSAVNIQSADLPPEFADAATRELAVRTRSELSQQLYDFARTPDEKGMLPNNTALEAKSKALALQAKTNMSSAFTTVANTNRSTAVLMLKELQGVDLNDDAAVAAAFAKATARKANPTNITAARSAVENYRKNIKQSGEGSK